MLLNIENAMALVGDIFSALELYRASQHFTTTLVSCLGRGDLNRAIFLCRHHLCRLAGALVATVLRHLGDKLPQDSCQRHPFPDSEPSIGDLVPLTGATHLQCSLLFVIIVSPCFT